MFGIYITSVGQDGTPEGTGEITFGGIDIDQLKIQGDELFINIMFVCFLINMYWIGGL